MSADPLGGRQIIPPETLRGLTPDKIDWERSTLVDDDGQLWIDILVEKVGVEALIAGDEGPPLRICGRRPTN